MSWFNDWLLAMWTVLAESGPYLLIGFFVAGLLEVFIPRAWIQRHLGGRGIFQVVKAALVGAPVPLCSCSVLPTAAQLRREGAGPGATTAFLIATPETGVDSVGISYALLDPMMTLARPLAAISTAVISGLAVDGSGVRIPAPPASQAATCSDSCAESCSSEGEATGPGHHSLGSRLARAVRYAYGTLLEDLAPWFVIGFALAALITLAIPADFFEESSLVGLPAMGLMLLAGIPLYVCATASTPIAAALIAKGLEPGPALVFLLAGPATNIATMGVIRRLLGGRALSIYLASIALCSVAAGALIDGLYGALDLTPRAFGGSLEPEELGPTASIAGAILGLLLAWHLARLLARRLRRPGGTPSQGS